MLPLAGAFLLDHLLVAGAVALATALVVLHFRRTFEYWAHRGVRSPAWPLPLFGNSLVYFKRSRRELEVEMARKLGKLYGYYSGSQPVLVVADAAVLKKVCVSDFSSFKNHYKLGGLPTSFQKNFLILQKGDKWKRMRSAMSTTFTSSKMRRMFAIIDRCANDLVSSIDEQMRYAAGAIVIDGSYICRLYALDSISSCGYGFSMSRQKSLDAPDSANDGKATRDSLSDVIKGIFTINRFRFFANYLLPDALLQAFNLSLFSENGMAYLAERLKELMKRRRNSKNKYNDYLQLLMDACVTDELNFTEMDAHENHHLGATSETLLREHKDLVSHLTNGTSRPVNDPKLTNGTAPSTNLRGQLSDQEILCNAIMFLMVGTETSQAAMSDLIYMLAHHKDEQDKLYAELRKIWLPGSSNELTSFDYETITTCKYLDAAISEGLRLMPPVIYMDRLTETDFYISEYDVTVEKETPVNLAYFAIHHDADYWPEPYRFCPDRFMPENKQKIVPGSYCPFGLGPRACIAMRFSLAEMKLGIGKLLSAFEFSPAPNSVYPPKARRFSFFQNQSVDLRVTVQRRGRIGR